MVLVEACANAGWVHDQAVAKGHVVKVANIAHDAWKFRSLSRGKGRAAHALRLAAWSLMRSKGALGAYLRRQRGRLGAPKAITATAHKLARIVYHLMRFGEGYVKRSEEEYAAEVRDRQEKQLQRRAKELGYELRKREGPATG